MFSDDIARAIINTSNERDVTLIVLGVAFLAGSLVFTDTIGAFEDDHVPFINAGVPAVDIIDLNNYAEYWHTAKDDLDRVSAKSLKIVGDVVLAALPDLERHLSR